jgi:hypothetical protein
MGAGRLGGESQNIDRFRGIADPRQAMRAAALEVLAEIHGTLPGECAQQP